MIDALSYFTTAAILNGALEAGKWLVGTAVEGSVGNSAHSAICRAAPLIRNWYRGEGQPANHHVQRALRSAYLAATKDLLKFVKSDAERLSPKRIYRECVPWCDGALGWVEKQIDLLRNDQYVPPLPPAPWEPAYIIESASVDAQKEVAALREMLSRMLLEEWTQAELLTPPQAVADALEQGWTEPNAADANQRITWFDLIGVYFANEIKTRPPVQAIFQASTLSQVLIELRAFRNEHKHQQNVTGRHRFFAPTAPDYFVGRQEELALLAARLALPGAVVPLIGMPGLGKTSLAIQFAHTRQNDFEGVFWIKCAGQTLAVCTAELASQLGIKPEGAPDAQLREVRQLCAERHYLLVLDNVEANEMGELLAGGAMAVLLTTRFQDLPFLARYRAPELKLFTPEDCLAVFREHLSAAEVTAHEAQYLHLADHLGRLPLAVAIAAGLLQNDLRYSLERLLAYAKPHTLAHGEMDINALLGAAVQSAGDDARRLLFAMAVCAPSEFGFTLAAEVAQLPEEAALDALQELRSRSLVDIYDRQKLRCHLHSLIRAQVGQDASLQWHHAEAVANRFSHWEQSWQDCEADLEDWRIALKWIADFEADASQRMDLLATLAFRGFSFTYRRGLLVDAREAMQTVAIGYEVLGNRKGLQRSLGNQALILQAWGKLEDAIALLKTQEAICLELGDHDGLQRSLGNQALILKTWGKLDDAMALLKTQEAICLELGDHDGLQRSLGNQALILKAWGKLEDAMALLKTQEAICLELGDRDGLQASYGNQAAILEAWGKLEDAMALCKKGEAIAFGLGDRTNLQRSYGSQAAILLALGKLDDAMTLYKKQEAIALELGDRDGLQHSYGNQALILQIRGKLADAMALHKKKETICLELGDRASLQVSYGNQAAILQICGKLEDAMALHKKKETICLELGDRARLQSSYGNQALILQAWGELDEAMALHKKQEAICLELGIRISLQRSYGNQALILQAWGKLDEAMTLHKKQEAICRELGIQDSLRISLHNQAHLLDASGQSEKAALLRAEAEAIHNDIMRGKGTSA